MAPKPPPTDFPTYSFASANDFESFLDREHATAPGIYLKLAKKASGILSVTAAEAVEIALCFGWIDGRANSVDDAWWTVRYTPRRSKSIWSQKNVATVAHLTEAGRMKPAGLEAVRAAKADGRWERAYAGPATIEVPADFQEALAVQEAAKAFFEGLNRSDRYSVLWRIETASPTSRAGRIVAMVEMLSVGNVPGAESAAKYKKPVQAKQKGKPPNKVTKQPLSKKRAQPSGAAPTRRSSRTRSTAQVQ
jgi:uncharacterized protein YdeI (YjbR/CyaY-like superfamily)